MNKLISKIVGVALGLTLATGVGAGVVLGNQSLAKAAASTSPISIDLTTVSTTSYSDDALVWAYDEVTVTASKESGTKVTNYWPGTSGKSYTQTRLYNNNKITFAPASGYQIDSITITATSSSYIFIGTAATGTNVASITTSGATATVTPTTKTSNVVLACNGTGRYTAMTVSFSAASSLPEINLSKENLYVATTTETTLDVAYTNLTNNISISQSGSGVVDLSTDGETYASSLTLDKSETSPQTIYVKGKTAGSVTLTAASSGATSKTCTINVSAPVIYKKITKTAEIKDGGKFVLLATGSTKAISNNQLSNGRGSIDATIIDGDINLPSVTDVGIFTFTKGTGTYADYYTIFDSAYGDNGGYLEYYNSNLTCYYTSSTPSTDAYYWSISFSSDHVVLECKANSGNYLEYNSSANVFRLYSGTQTKVDLYELESDIPSGTALTSITAENVSVGAGATITYTGSYAPTNATEAIEATLNNDVATLSSVAMSNGTFTITITAGSSAGSATLTLVGEDGHGSTTVTLTVTAFASTHHLVYSAAALANGSKVIIGSQADAANTNYASAAHTGGDYVPVTPTAYSSDKTMLAADSNAQEYTVWCVDSTNGYYVIAANGYYLAAPTSAGNKLQRTDVLSSRNYFAITDDSENGILLTSQYSVNNFTDTYVLRYNYNGGTNARFALYKTGTQTAASLFISNDNVDSVQGFIDVFMHMSSYTTSKDYCSDEDHHYFADAKAAFNGMSDLSRQNFVTDSAYASAYQRLSAWAAANGETFNASNRIVEAANSNMMNTVEMNNSALIVVVVAAFVSTTFIGGYFLLRKKKEN